MAAEQNGTRATTEYNPVIRTFARGWLTEAPEFRRSNEGVAVCRLVVAGEAPGPASNPPKVSLYIRGTEAVRCALGLQQGDLIEGIGVVGPERKRAPRQEVVVDERVKLRARAAAA